MKVVCSLEMTTFWFFLVLEIVVITNGIHAQSTTRGFISIDCGMASGDSYLDDTTGILYVSDDQYTDLGTNYNVSSEYLSSTPRQQSTLRSFPNGKRSCYTLKPVAQYHKYLLRASFTYGNYDGRQRANTVKPLQFDLHIDVNWWETVNITDESTTYRSEAIIVALANNSVSVCLINTGNGVPFMSALELRPLPDSTYSLVNTARYLLGFMRLNMGTNDTIRYPRDPYDRIWTGDTWRPMWMEISTSSTVENFSDDDLPAPSDVMQTAVTPGNGTTNIAFFWDFAGSGLRHNEFYAFFHFSELVLLGPNQSRVIDIYLNGEVWQAGYSPPYLRGGYVYSTTPLTPNDTYVWKLTSNATSTLPPILNAVEVYSPMYLTNVSTDAGDVDAITSIKAQYKLKKDWTGDPCAPIEYMWEGLNCSYSPDSQSIIAVNLSSSELTGEISPSFAMLTAIKYLDLSYNNLTGTIPDAFGDLSSLQVLYLRGNNISRQVPASLNKRLNGGLQIIFDNDTNPVIPCGNCNDKKNNTLVIVIISVVAVVLVLLIAVAFTVWRKRRSHRGLVPNTPRTSSQQDYSPSNKDDSPCNENYFGQIPHPEDHQIPQSRQFAYMQLAKITKNFDRIIGRGGFGNVYHGCLETRNEVAIKLCSQSSPRGAKQFLAEIQNLTKAHHRNLVSLIGYCIDGTFLALVYEYMPQGSLHDHLRGRYVRALSWRERIQIAIGAAQGLEYLHKGCSPPIIHRDIKSANILLSKELEAKIADFGLSKAFRSDDHSHVSTNLVVGTPGYVDPEYHNSFQLTEKSDVFSFGVVLLELVTGQPPVVPGSGKPHIIQQVTSRLVDGNIDEIIDQRLEGGFDANSAWKVVDLAKLCTAQTGSQRPTMSELVIQLKDSLELEAARWKRENRYNEDFASSQTSAFEIGGNISGPVGPFAR